MRGEIKVSMANTVLFYSRDPGGTNQLIALYTLVHSAQTKSPLATPPSICTFISGVFDDTTRLVITAKDAAVVFWNKAGISVEDWSALGPNECVERLHELAPSHLITSTTDVDDRTDLILWQAANAIGIPSTAFTDHKINLMRRFMDNQEQIVYPDCVFVTDEECRDILIQGGLTAGRVLVGEDLHISLLQQQIDNCAPDCQAMRKLWSVSPDETVILFLSENTSEMCEAGRPGSYDEFECLEYVIGELSKKRSDVGGRAPFMISDATLVIRPHPKDRPNKYAAYERAINPKVVISREGNGTTAVATSNMIIGMRSSLFEEAAVLNIPVISLVDANGRFHGGGIG